MANELDGRTAIVTGAGQGIGRAIALALAEIGAKVVINDIGRAKDGAPTAEGVVQEIQAAGGQAAASLESVVDYEAAASIVETALQHFGSADILINNAGVARPGLIWEADAEEFERITGVHIAGSFNCMRHAVVPMRERGWGRVVNLVSRSGITGIPGSVVYGIAKGGVFGLTNASSRDLAQFGITVNSVCPASTRTKMVENSIARLREQGPAEQKRADGLLALMQTPDKVANAIAALCTEEAGGINGQHFLIEHDHIGLFQPLTVTQQVENEPGWSSADLASAIARLDLHDLTDAYSGGG